MRGRKGMMTLPVGLIAGITTIVFQLGGCANDECLDNKNSLPLAGFYASDSMASTLKPTAISLDSVTIYGIGAPGDSLLHDSVRGLTRSYLPFQIDKGETQYVIRYHQKELSKFDLADTITFRYDPVPFFVSSACGVIYDYRDVRIETTHWIIDSVTCPLGYIDNADIENIKIYFRVSE